MANLALPASESALEQFCACSLSEQGANFDIEEHVWGGIGSASPSILHMSDVVFDQPDTVTAYPRDSAIKSDNSVLGWSSAGGPNLAARWDKLAFQ